MLLIAGALAALAQYLLPAATVAPPVETVRPAAEPAGPPPVRQILALPEVSRAAPAPAPQPALRPAVPATATEKAAPASSPAPAPAPPPAPAPVQLPVDAAVVPVPPPSAAPQGEAEVAEARTTEGPPAVALIDLNSAPVADLNRLRGGGNIGRAIAAKRPYAAVSDLLTKRVLSRSVFERIREQVTVR